MTARGTTARCVCCGSGIPWDALVCEQCTDPAVTAGTVDALGPVPVKRVDLAAVLGDLAMVIDTAEADLRHGRYVEALDALRQAKRHPAFRLAAQPPELLRHALAAPRQTHGDTGGIPEPPE